MMPPQDILEELKKHPGRRYEDVYYGDQPFEFPQNGSWLGPMTSDPRSYCYLLAAMFGKEYLSRLFVKYGLRVCPECARAGLRNPLKPDTYPFCTATCRRKFRTRMYPQYCSACGTIFLIKRSIARARAKSNPGGRVFCGRHCFENRGRKVKRFGD